MGCDGATTASPSSARCPSPTAICSASAARTSSACCPRPRRRKSISFSARRESRYKMNDREFESTKQRITFVMKDWMQALSLNWWNVVIMYDREPQNRLPVDYVSSYSDADIRLMFNAPAILAMSDSELDTLVAPVLARTLQTARQVGARKGNHTSVTDAARATARNIGLVVDADVRRAE